jgi:hypothetical protein
MKKITLLLAACAFGATVNAQDFAAQSNSPAGNSNANTSEAILFDQPSVGGSGIVSCFSNDAGFGVYSSDDFEITDDATVETITAYGFNNNQNLESNLTGLDVYIYNNLSGLNIPDSDPTQTGTGVLELVDLAPGSGAFTIDNDGAGGYAFVIDVVAANGSGVGLTAGNYWLVVAPRINNIPGFEGADRWNQYDAGVPTAGVNEAHLIDPNDFFGAGATGWTSFTDLGLTFASTAMTIEGELGLSVGNNALAQVSIYPNPASSTLNVEVPGTVEINGAVLYDVLGKDTGVRLNNGVMNIASLARGVYILNMETSAGAISQKIVKQ